MNPIIKIFPNETTWFNTDWERPFQRFKIETIPLRFIFLSLLFILIMWFGIAYLVGLSNNSAWIIFITLITWMSGVVYYSFPSKEHQLIPLSLFLIPPALSVILNNILQIKPTGITVSFLYLMVIIFLWGKKVVKEIEREPFLVLLSATSLFISLITIVLELVPPTFANNIFDVYPFFAPVIILWTNLTFLYVRAIAGVIIFIAAFAMAIMYLKSEGLIYNINKIDFRKVSEQTEDNILNSFLNSLIKLFNAIIIPFAEVLTFTLLIVFVYVVTTVVFFLGLLFLISVMFRLLLVIDFSDLYFYLLVS